MIILEPDETDSKEFLACIEGILNGVVLTMKPRIVIVVKIKNWFGEKWVRFSGKTLGLLGVWQKDVTIPPFIPSRVLKQTCFERSKNDGSYSLRPARLIHRWQQSGRNFNRKVRFKIPDNSVIFWYSSNSSKHTRGSFMTYMIKGEEQPWTWYVEWQKSLRWTIVRLHNISRNEITLFTQNVINT